MESVLGSGGWEAQRVVQGCGRMRACAVRCVTQAGACRAHN